MDKKKQIALLDKLTSEYVRRSYANSRGYAPCYTCGRMFFWKELDCGHLIKRSHYATRWDLENLRPQCQICNRLLGGNYKIYTEKMKKELGQERYDALWRKSRQTYKFYDLDDRILEMTHKLEFLDESQFF